MSREDHSPNDPENVGPPPRDELDKLLRAWHQESAQRAAASRERLIEAFTARAEADPDTTEGYAGRDSRGGACEKGISHERDGGACEKGISHERDGGACEKGISHERASLAAAADGDLEHDPARGSNHTADATAGEGPAARRLRMIRSVIMNRYSAFAAAVVLLAALIPVLVPRPGGEAVAQEGIIMVPEGGRLDALDNQGNVIGPCPLQHTDVQAEVSGRFVRVTLTQKYKNPYPDKIEAVYTFPMSHRAAVDRMNMVIGDRVVVGEVHERQVARTIYESARKRGYVASLLEQERPNIFTQSVANIEPQAEIDIEISYVELLECADGTFTFDFPMVVGPRYIPGSMKTAAGDVPAGLTGRHGVVLLGPAKLTATDFGESAEAARLGALQEGKLQALLNEAVPVRMPDVEYWHERSAEAAETEREAPATQPAVQGPQLWQRFEAVYCDGSKEIGELYTGGIGQLNGRWFHVDPNATQDMGTGYSADTTQVPDASRITPMPVKPPTRAGHDISVEVTIDTGGPGIVDLASALHEIVRVDNATRPDGHPRKVRVALKDEVDIPNRDFVLSWRQTADTIEEATFTHTGEMGNFFTLMIQPPERVEDAQVVPRELIFVLDTSGSMSGFPIETAKSVMARAIDALRPQDTFNLITFAGDTHILWDKPRPFNEANRQAAQAFLATRKGGGGTEMMKAINAALVQTCEGENVGTALTPEELANLPADGREVTVRFSNDRLVIYGPEDDRQPKDERGESAQAHREWGGLVVRDDLIIPMTPWHVPFTDWLRVSGPWKTVDGRRILEVKAGGFDEEPARPVRICCFMTDGYVGNDMAIIDAVKRNSDTTRVFSFGIGKSVNKYLLDGMARAGRGEVEYVLQESDCEGAAKRFATRIQTPVLTNIELEFSDGLEIVEQIPARVPDLHDEKPIIIHGKYVKPGTGTLTVRGNTGSGRYVRTMDLVLPESQPAHSTIATLWARAKVRELMERDLTAVQQQTLSDATKQEIIRVGEQFRIMTQFTSFVAVEKARVTVGGEPRLVAVPIELPEGVSWEGVFGELGDVNPDDFVVRWSRHTLDVDVDGDGTDTSDAAEDQPEEASGDSERRRARWHRTQQHHFRAETEIQTLINEGKLDEARQRIEQTEQLLDAGRGDADSPEKYMFFKRRLHALADQIANEESQAGEKGEIAQRRAALEQERFRQNLSESEKTRRINDLFNQANKLTRDREHKKAADTLRGIIAIDPNHEKAKWRLEALEDAMVIEQERRDYQRMLERMEVANAGASRAKTPEIVWGQSAVKFPDEEAWSDISSRPLGDPSAVTRQKCGQKGGGDAQAVRLETNGQFIRGGVVVQTEDGDRTLALDSLGYVAPGQAGGAYGGGGIGGEGIGGGFGGGGYGGGGYGGGYGGDDDDDDEHGATDGTRIAFPFVNSYSYSGPSREAGSGSGAGGSNAVNLKRAYSRRGDRPGRPADAPASTSFTLNVDDLDTGGDATQDFDGSMGIVAGVQSATQGQQGWYKLPASNAPYAFGDSLSVSGGSLLVNGDVNGDGAHDLLIGGVGDDVIAHAGFGRPFFVSDFDVSDSRSVPVVSKIPTEGITWGVQVSDSGNATSEDFTAINGVANLVFDLELKDDVGPVAATQPATVANVTTRPAGDVQSLRTTTRPAGEGETAGPTTRPAREIVLANISPAWFEGPVAPSRVILAIARLVEDGRVDQARETAVVLVSLAPKYTLAVQMRDVLVDEDLEPADRDRRVAEIGEQARAEIDAFVRQVELQRNLDPRLYRWIHDEQAKADELGFTLTDDKLRVTVAAEETDAAMIDALKGAGLAVDDAAHSLKLVVGTVTRDKLADVALVSGVRRVEPTVMD